MRLILDPPQNGYQNMAVDQAIFTSVISGGDPTLRIYSWETPTITIGYFQNMALEVDLKKAQEKSIPIIRRKTGGGTVLHDHEITYSIVIPIDKYPELNDILSSYEFLTRPIIASLSKCGVIANFSPLNDLKATGKKFSGNAQTRKNGVILQHGTLLLSVDVDKMFSLLKIPNEKLRDKMITSAKEGVIGISHLMTCDHNSYIQKLVIAFQELFQTQFISSELTQQEIDLKKKFTTSFLNPKWTIDRDESVFSS